MPRFEPRNPDFRRIATETFGRQQAMQRREGASVPERALSPA